MKTFLMLLILILCIVPVGAVDWHDDSRLKRIQLNVNNSSVALTDYQLMKIIAYDSDMQADFDDLLFYNESGANVPYWIESKTNSTSADIWLKIPTISTTEGAKVLMYYGNTSSSSASSIFDTGLTGSDDFTDGLSRWTGDTAHASIVDDVLIYDTDGVNSWTTLKSTSSFDDNVIVESITRLQSGTEYARVGFTDGTIGLGVYTHTIMFYHHGAGVNKIGNSISSSEYTGISSSFANDAFTTFKIVWTETNNHFYENNIEVTGSPFNTHNPSAYSIPIGYANHGSVLQSNYIFARKYTAVEPTWGTDGDEESYETSLNGTFLYPNSSKSSGWYGKLISEMLYETGINLSDLSTFTLLTTDNLESLSIDDIDYISLDKTAANDGYLYVNFSLPNVKSVNFLNVRTVHNRNATNPVILGLLNVSAQKWHVVNNSSVADTDVEMTYNISGSDIIKYTTLINGNLNLSVSFNTNGDENEDVFIDLIEVYVDYENTTAQEITLGYVYNLTMSNQNNISTLQTDIDNMNNSVSNLYLFVLLCTVFLLVVFRKRGDT